MPLKYFDAGLACDDCTLAIANNDYSGMSDARAQEVESALESLNRNYVIGDEYGFSRQPCDICGTRFHGNRHHVGYLEETNTPETEVSTGKCFCG